MADAPENLDQLLDRFCSAPARDDDRVTLRCLLEEVGSRSFGPLLLFAGVLMTSPLSGVPGMPTTFSILVLLLCVQLLLRRDHFWLPRWLLERSVARSKLERAVGWLRRPARFIDRFLRPRLTAIVSGGGVYLIAALCGLLSLAAPSLEVVPFSATLVGAAVATFGLALTARDGLLCLLGIGVTVGAVTLVLYHLL